MLKRLAVVLSLFILCWITSGCNMQGAQYPEDQELLYQVSTINALLDGAYDGQVGIAELKNRGDIGIGTFSSLDGEMIIIDGNVYKAKFDGTVESVDDKQTTPFAAVTFFNEDQRIDEVFCIDYEGLQNKMNTLIDNSNLFYAFEITGDFSYVKVRSVPPQEKPYPPLVQVTENQPVFEYENVKGTLVGFWCPAYVSGINVPGYHLHFISEDKTMGGHLLEAKGQNITIIVDQTPSFQMTLPEDIGFGNLKLEEDKTSELEKAEK